MPKQRAIGWLRDARSPLQLQNTLNNPYAIDRQYLINAITHTIHQRTLEQWTRQETLKRLQQHHHYKKAHTTTHSDIALINWIATRIKSNTTVSRSSVDREGTLPMGVIRELLREYAQQKHRIELALKQIWKKVETIDNRLALNRERGTALYDDFFDQLAQRDDAYANLPRRSVIDFLEDCIEEGTLSIQDSIEHVLATFEAFMTQQIRQAFLAKHPQALSEAIPWSQASAYQHTE